MNLIIPALMFLAWIAICCCIGYNLRKKWDAAQKKSTVERQTSICPYCGNVETKFREAPNPAFWTCSECRRVWGDSVRMTEEERSQRDAIDRECARIQTSLPNLLDIIEEAYERTKAANGSFWLQDGQIWYYGSRPLEKKVIGYYDEEIVSTKPGRLYVANACLRYCKEKHKETSNFHTQFRGWLTDDGLAWEWHFEQK